MSDKLYFNEHGMPFVEEPQFGIISLGCLKPDPNFSAIPAFADRFQVLPESQWQENSLRGFDPPQRNQAKHGSCFPAGTRIRMIDGSEKPIEQIRLLEEVVTAEGNTGKVRGLMVRKTTKGLVRLHLWGHSHLRMTPEHPVLTKRGYIAASELRRDDWVAMPRYMPVHHSFIQTAEHTDQNRWTIKSERQTRYSGVVGRAAAVITRTPIPDIIHLTEGAGRIFGFFLAEGSTDRGKVMWTFGEHETETHVAELVRLLNDEWGVTAKLQPKPTNHSIKVIVYGVVWAKFFESLCASGAGYKKLHPDITSGPEKFMSAMLSAWMDGDGYVRDRGKQKHITEAIGSTISHDLALSMFDVAQWLGLRPNIRVSLPTTNKYAKTRQPRWEVCWGAKGDNYRVEQDPATCHIWHKVRGVVEEEFEGEVYNLSVEGDESYVAEGVGVHNCTGQGTVTAFTVAKKKSAPLDNFPVLSATFIYGMINGGRDRGAQCSQAMLALQQYGTCLDSQVSTEMIFKNQFPAESYQTANRFKALEAYKLNSWEELATALSLGIPCVSGIAVGRNFTRNQLRANGLAYLPDVIVGGHCMAHLGLVRLDGIWAIETMNSWTSSWGVNGWCYLQKEHWNPGYGFPFDAFAIYSVSDDPVDPEANPPGLVDQLTHELELDTFTEAKET